MIGKRICNFVFLTVLYGVLLIELNYLSPGVYFGSQLLTLGYFVGVFYACYRSNINRMILLTYSFLYAVSVVFSCLIANTDISLPQLFVDIIRNTEWIMVFFIAFYVGNRIHSLSFLSKLVSYVILPVVYVMYYLILSRTYFVGDSFGYRDAIFPVIMLTPLALFTNHKIKYLHIVLSLVFVLISAKRSAIIAVFIASVIYFLISTTQDKKKKLGVVIPLIFITLTIYYLSTKGLFSFGLERFNNISDDGGGGRDGLYSILLNSFKKSNLFEQLFGHGTASTKNVVNKLAHNDFLQIAYDYGVVSLLFFSLFYFGLIRMAFVMRKKISDFNNEYAVYLYNLVLFVVIGFFNCFVSSPITFSVSILCFGYVLGYYYYLKAA